MPNLPLVPGTLPYNCWPASPQSYYNDIFTLGAAVQTSSLTGVLLQDATPTADQTGFVWIRTSAGAPVFPPVWTFYSGQWVAKHPIPASDLRLVLFSGLDTDVPTLDGGAAGPVSVNSGPLWEIVGDFAARMPIGVGTLPSGVVLTSGSIGGEEKHLLLAAESGVGPHTHEERCGTPDSDAIGGSGANRRTFSGSGFPDANAIGSAIQTANTQQDAATAHNCLPPYRAVYFLRRTSRIYLTQPIA